MRTEKIVMLQIFISMAFISFIKEKEVQNLSPWAIPQSSKVNSRAKTEQGMDFLPLSRAELQGLPSVYPTLFDVCHFVLAAIAIRSSWDPFLYSTNYSSLFAAGKSLDSTSPELIHLLPGWLIFPPLLQVASYFLKKEKNWYVLPLPGSLVCNPLLGKPVTI